MMSLGNFKLTQKVALLACLMAVLISLVVAVLSFWAFPKCTGKCFCTLGIMMTLAGIFSLDIAGAF